MSHPVTEYLCGAVTAGDAAAKAREDKIRSAAMAATRGAKTVRALDFFAVKNCMRVLRSAPIFLAYNGLRRQT